MSARGPYLKGRKRREEILATALDVFSRAGYRGTSLRAIARELGIGPSLVQYYFETREQLLMDVIETWDMENRRRNGSLPTIDGFVQGIRYNASIPGLIHLYTAFAVEASDPDHSARTFFEQRYSNMTARFVSDLEDRKESGMAPTDLDSDRAARLLIASCEGLQVRWLHTPNFDMASEFEAILTALGIQLDPNLEDERHPSPHESTAPATAARQTSGVASSEP